MRFRPYLLAALAAVFLPASAPAIDTTTTPKAPDGTYPAIDFPAARHIRNIGGSDGAGLCVFTSIDMLADWHNGRLTGFQKWMSTRPGGGYPEKVDAEITLFCASKNVPVPAYVQHVGGDDTILDLAIKTGRMVGITYAGNDGFYSGPIMHMVNLAHIDATHGAIIDNNRPGKWIWMTRQQLLNRWRGIYDNGSMMTVREGGQTFQVGGGWAFITLAPPPPPYAKNPAVAAVSPAIPELVNFGVTPQPPAAPKAEAAPPETNFGVDVQKLRAVNRKFTLNGTEVSKSVAVAAVLADDSDRYHLTFVGVPLPPSPGIPAAVRDRVQVQAYAPGEWEVGQFGLRPGVTLRKPATGRVGPEVYHADAYDTSAILAAINGDPVKPDPATPAGPLGAITIGTADLTDAARARLDAAGIGAVTLTVVPKAAPVPMPGPVAPKTESGPAPIIPVASTAPTTPAPPGKRWAKLGGLDSPAPWLLEDAPVPAPRPMPLNFQLQGLRGTAGQCPGGVCPTR